MNDKLTPPPADERWTISYRKPTANHFKRVANWAGTWHEAVEMAAIVLNANPDLQVYYTPTAAWEATWTRPSDIEDIARVLVDNDRWVEVRETGSIPADVLDAWSTTATYLAEGKLLDSYLAAKKAGEEPSEAEEAAYLRAMERAAGDEVEPTPEQEAAAAAHEPTEAEIDAAVAVVDGERAALELYVHERMYSVPEDAPTYRI